MGCTNSQPQTMGTYGNSNPIPSNSTTPKKSNKANLLKADKPPNTFESPAIKRARLQGLDVPSDSMTSMNNQSYAQENSQSSIFRPPSQALEKFESSHNIKQEVKKLYTNGGENLTSSLNDEMKLDYMSNGNNANGQNNAVGDGMSSWGNDELVVKTHGLILHNVTAGEMKKYFTVTPQCLEIRDKSGLTPLHLAAKLGRFDAMKLLLELHANVNAKTLEGNTPLHLAIGYNRFDCAVLLKHSGADEEARNDNGYRACTGFDGTGSYGVAALFAASGIKQADIAIKVCEHGYEDLNLLRFLDGVAILRKTLQFKGWGEEQEAKYQAILVKIKSKEKVKAKSILKGKSSTGSFYGSPAPSSTHGSPYGSMYSKPEPVVNANPFCGTEELSIFF